MFKILLLEYFVILNIFTELIFSKIYLIFVLYVGMYVGCCTFHALSALFESSVSWPRSIY